LLADCRQVAPKLEQLDAAVLQVEQVDFLRDVLNSSSSPSWFESLHQINCSALKDSVFKIQFKAALEQNKEVQIGAALLELE